MSPKAKSPSIVEREPVLDPESEKPSAKRVSFPVNDDGSIDLSSIRPKTLAQLKEVIAASPELRGASSEGGPTPEDEKFPRAMVPPIWDSIATLTRTVGKIFLKWPDQLTAAMKFSADEKAALTEPTALMIDKYGSGLKKYAVELNFVNAVANNVGTMVTRAVQDFVAGLPQDPTQVKPNGHDPSRPAERPPVQAEAAPAMRAI